MSKFHRSCALLHRRQSIQEFKGDPNRGYRQEEGTLISHSGWVDEQYELHVAEMEEEA